MNTARLASLFVVTLAAACAPRPSVPSVSMRMSGQPTDASVTIDDVLVGTLGLVQQRGVGLPEGAHRVTVEAAGYFPWDRMVEARAGQPLRLDVTLIRIPE